MSEFNEQREAVIDYLRNEMIAQGATPAIASMAVAGVKLWNFNDVRNLYKCIKSDLPENVIKEIVTHDYNGLMKHDEFFLPKSSQFGVN